VLADLPKGARVIDVGSGGGLPGLPLAVCMPHLQFTLLEATGKKVDFLRATTAALQLRNVEVVQARAESLAHDRGDRTNNAGKLTRANARRESYDAVVARAVGRLCTLLELVVPFAKVGGLVALTKGAKAQEELDEAKEALHQLKAVAGPLIPTLTSTIVIIEKPSATPKVYPRADGEPARSPIGVRSERAEDADPRITTGPRTGGPRDAARPAGKASSAKPANQNARKQEPARADLGKGAGTKASFGKPGFGKGGTGKPSSGRSPRR
jgi:16S rRNA (guanine(527)-N(7))-methyltransferase RsmG